MTDIISAIIFLLGLYFAWWIYDYYKSENKKLAEQKSELDTYWKNLGKQQDENSEKHKSQLEEISRKREEVRQYHQRALDTNEEACKLHRQSLHQINAYKNQITKLQSELNNARQRSKRLAKKVGDAV